MKRKNEPEAEIENNKRYKASSISDDVKTFAAKLYIEFERDGLKKSDFLMKMENAGYKIGKSTFDRYISNLSTTGSVLSIEKSKIQVHRLCYQERRE